MGIEIERKFLVSNDTYRDLCNKSKYICQGYLCREPARTVRIRTSGEKGYVTIKGLTKGCERQEFEYEIPYSDAESLLRLCEPPVICKTRYYVPSGSHTWEVDEFDGELRPLVTAEIELASADEAFSKPDFVGEEITGNPAYYNSNLGKSGCPV